MLYDFSLAKELVLGNRNNKGKQPTVWKKPKERYVNTNWDVTLDEKAKRIGMGFIIRNEDSEVVTAACSSNENIVQPALAECMVLLRAAEFCQARGFSQVILEGDALQIVQAINQRDRRPVMVQPSHRSNQVYFKVLSKLVSSTCR